MYLLEDDPDVLMTSCFGGKLCFWDLAEQKLISKWFRRSRVSIRMDNVHTAGHSNRYFLNDPVPILDFRFCRERNSIIGVDDDGSVLM